MLQLLRPLVRTALTRPSGRYMHQQISQKRGGGKVPEKIKQAQKLFQEKNNLPVFLKGGRTDKILYYTTMGLAVTGLACNVALFAHYIID